MDDLVQRLRGGVFGDLRTLEACYEASDEIARLRAQLAERGRDVERYRWLRARKPGGKYRIAGLIYSDGDEHFDAAIDAAMAKAER